MKNQMMQVKLGDYGTFMIGHKTEMGKVDQIIQMGNDILEEKNGKQMTLDQILRSNDFWLFIIELEAKRLKVSVDSTDSLNSNEFPNDISNLNAKNVKVSADSAEGLKVDYSTLKEYQDSKGNIQYSKLIPLFPNQIKVQKRGKMENIGTWMNLHALLKVASYMDKALEVEIYDCFIKGNILQHRDDGGEQFKLLNAQIDTLSDRLPDVKPKGNKGVYIQISKLVRTKLEIIDSFGYNEEDHTAAVQTNRGKIIETATNLIKMGMITTYPQLKAFILNYPITK